ncbi:Chaperone protein TorD [Caenispirillum salinarum AK4]|uniref:Chaperone protein TorD n=1 Tax=Caenispirillum salinarum AK4 TaxID=1238182 RepID=K9GSF8_9PROT|nr:molecular chaperone TorD family protein [Caenispirillum salinarum]EKV28930.1 Chaperone protein TorD [Caenispirillum salinarum AK4]
MTVILAATDRAHLLDWLASVFLREPDAAAIAALRGPLGQRAVTDLAEAPALAGGVEAMLDALRAVHRDAGSDADAALALSARFGTLFLGAGGPDAAHPYASVYEEGRTHGAATDRARAVLDAHNLSVAEGTAEPADHFGIMLGALAELSRREAADAARASSLFAAQAAFARADVAPWLTPFRERVDRDDPTGYYAAAARLAETAVAAFYARETD